MSDWLNKAEKKVKGLVAEAAEELTAAEGVDTVHLSGDDDPADDSDA